MVEIAMLIVWAIIGPIIFYDIGKVKGWNTCMDAVQKEKGEKVDMDLKEGTTTAKLAESFRNRPDAKEDIPDDFIDPD